MIFHLKATQSAALKTVLEMGVLKNMPRDGAISVSKLATDSNVDEGLLGNIDLVSHYFVLKVNVDVRIVRLLRQLSSTGILKSVGENEYRHTEFSLAYIDRSEIDFFNLV